MDSCGLTEDDLPAVVMPGTTLKRATPGELAEKLGPQLPPLPRQAGRRHDRRRGPGRAGGRCLRGVRGPGHAAARRCRHRRAGRRQLPDRELLRLPVRPFRRRPDRPGRAPGAEVRRPAGQPLPGGQARHRLRTAACSACTFRAGKSSTAKPSSSRPAPATGRCRWNAGPTSRAPVSTTRPPSWKPEGASGSPVTVIGGANSAGQAALYLAGRGSEVSLVVRGPDIAAEHVGLPRRPAAGPPAGDSALPQRGHPAGWRRLPRGGQHHRPDGGYRARPAVLGVVLLHRRRARPPAG